LYTAPSGRGFFEITRGSVLFSGADYTILIKITIFRRITVSEYITITGDNFEDEVLKSDVPVLIDFWASWCGPCKMIAPFIEQLAGEYAGRLKVGKVNVDEENQLAAGHGIASIPALVVYRGGKIVNQTAGALPKNEIEKLFTDFI
jgi:thioredoxin 1